MIGCLFYLVLLVGDVCLGVLDLWVVGVIGGYLGVGLCGRGRGGVLWCVIVFLGLRCGFSDLGLCLGLGGGDVFNIVVCSFL